MWIYDSSLCFKEIWGFIEILSFGAGFDLSCQFRAGPVDRSRDQSTDPETWFFFPFSLWPVDWFSNQSTDSGPVDRSRNQSSDPGTFSCFDVGLSSCFPRLFYWFLSMFSRIMPYLFYTGDGEWLVYRMWLGGAFTFKFFTLCYAFPGTTLRIPSVHEHPLRVPPLQDRTRCIASLIHQISLCHYDFKAVVDPVCNV